MIRPTTISISVNGSAPREDHFRFLKAVTPASRARLIALEATAAAALPLWVDAVMPKRISVDTTLATARGWVDGGAELAGVRQIRLATAADVDPTDVAAIIEPLLLRQPPLAIVVLLDASSRNANPARWTPLLRYPRLFINVGRGGGGDWTTDHLDHWEAELGDRLFTAIPPIAAAAHSRTRGRCPTLLGQHVWLHALTDHVGLCDCGGAADVSIHDDWPSQLGIRLRDLQRRKAIACGGCILWQSCGGGCIPARSHRDERDVDCPIPVATVTQ